MVHTYLETGGGRISLNLTNLLQQQEEPGLEKGAGGSHRQMAVLHLSGAERGRWKPPTNSCATVTPLSEMGRAEATIA